MTGIEKHSSLDNEMHNVYDRDEGHAALTVDASVWRLVKWPWRAGRRQPRFRRGKSVGNVFDSPASYFAQALPDGIDVLKKPRVMFQFVIEPIVFGAESNQDSGRLAMPRDDDLLLFANHRIYDRSTFTSDSAICFIGGIMPFQPTVGC